jgi:hypothetical protein
MAALRKLGCFLAVWGMLLYPGQPARAGRASACFKDSCFGLEVARTSEERLRGLMFRESLDEDKGMLFIFETEDIYPFWMENTYVALDIIWLAADQKVVFIAEDARPCLSNECPFIYPDRKAKYVLELNSGIVQRTGLKVGDTVDIHVFIENIPGE